MLDVQSLEWLVRNRSIFFLHYSNYLAEIRMSHLDRSYFVTMGTYQMAVLLQFNDHEQLTINEIEDATKLNTKEVEKQITSLVEAKFLLGNTVCFMDLNMLISWFEFCSRIICLPIQVYQSIMIIRVNEQNLKFL